jgi:hypothetical protein
LRENPRGILVMGGEFETLRLYQQVCKLKEEVLYRLRVNHSREITTVPILYFYLESLDVVLRSLGGWFSAWLVFVQGDPH